MQLRCLTCLLLIFLLSAGYPHHAAYSTPADNSALSKPDATAIPVALTFLQALSYSPENNTTLDSVVIPLKRAGRLLLVEAVVDNETGNLVFDTGANGLVFNSTYFRNHLKSGGPNSNGITGAIGAVEQITIDKIEFAGLTYKKIRADMTNLGHIENRRGVKILGLFGFNMIRNFEIQLDTKRNQLRLYRIDKSGNRVKSETSETKQSYSQSIKSNTNILILQGKIGGKILNFCLDTGAET
ncbi:MAG TPA: hypothetical protein VN249_09005, partial [Prolixibacteraceae bacterium]|nr:hypothetical protein [Prolixibacteraceae bacterium]